MNDDAKGIACMHSKSLKMSICYLTNDCRLTSRRVNKIILYDNSPKQGDGQRSHLATATRTHLHTRSVVIVQSVCRPKEAGGRRQETGGCVIRVISRHYFFVIVSFVVIVTKPSTVRMPPSCKPAGRKREETCTH